MRYSRWGWSRYETEAALSAEAALISKRVEVLPRQADAEIFVVNSGTAVDASLLDRIPSARLCITNTSGFEHLDLRELEARGVRAARLPMSRRDAVVECSLWGMIHGLRRHSTLLAGASRGEWLRPRLPDLGVRGVHGARVALVGLGVIGSRMVEVLQHLGANVVGVDPAVQLSGVEQLSLHEAICDADVLSLHCSLRAGDEGLVSAPLLARAKPGLVLVNTARGPLVSWDDACHSLAQGRLSAVVMDVFPEEPWPQMSGGLEGLLLTPHSAGFHDGLSASLTHELDATIGCFLAGEALPYSLC